MKSFVYILMVMAWAGAATSASAGLVAHWPGDGNTDELVAGRNASLNNGATYGPGFVGQAFSLDGSNDFVSVADDPAWTLGTNAFTVSLFVKFDAVRSGSSGQLPNVFIGHDNGGGATNKWIFYATANALYFHANGNGSVFLSPGANFSPVVDEWTHVAITRSGNVFTFYANGGPLGTANSSVNIPNPTVPLTFGQAEGLGYLNGSLDDVRIYDEALDSDAITALANIPEPTTGMAIVLAIGGLLHRRR